MSGGSLDGRKARYDDGPEFFIGNIPIGDIFPPDSDFAISVPLNYHFRFRWLQAREQGVGERDEAFPEG